MNAAQLPPALIRWIIGCVGTIAICYLTAAGLTRGRAAPLLATVAIPLGIVFVARLDLWLIALAGLFYSWVYIPGFPNSLSLYFVAMALCVPVLLAHNCARPVQHRASAFLKAAVAMYLGVVLMTIYYRGFGVRMLGSDTWGGAGYIHLIVALSFFLVSDPIQLSKKQWRWALVLFFLGGLIPSAAELVFVFTEGRVWFLYAFIRPEGSSAVQSLNIMRGGEGVLRFQVSKFISMIFVLMLCLYPFRRPYRWRIVLSLVIAAVFIGLSGHRSATIYLLLLVPMVMYFSASRFLGRLLVSYAVALVALVVVMHFAGQKLPMAMQRALSWVPYASISYEARASAASTLTWRLELWKRLTEQVPDYWIIGKGFAFRGADMRFRIHTFRDTVEWAITTHNYHNGPLSMLLDLGVLGLLSGSAFMVGVVVRHVRLLKATWHDLDLHRYHLVLLASLCVDIIRFYTIHGDASASMVAFTFQVVMLEAIRRTDQQLAAESAVVPERTVQPAALPPVPELAGMRER